MSKIFDVLMLCRKMLCYVNGKEFFICLMCNKNEVISIFGNAHQKLFNSCSSGGFVFPLSHKHKLSNFHILSFEHLCILVSSFISTLLPQKMVANNIL